MTRKMLLEQVWEFHFDPKTNIVETNISRLRTKIDRGRGVSLIQTVRGAGYTLRVRIRLLRTASFRLATIYLALFTASALALGAFVYLSIRHEILTDFDERIVEEPTRYGPPSRRTDGSGSRK